MAVVSDPSDPDHYRTSNIECWTTQLAALGKEGYVDYCLGNVIKYIYRAGHKGRAKDDLRKMLWYATKAVELIDDEQ